MLTNEDATARDRREDVLSNVFGVCSCIAENGISNAK